MPLRVKSDDHLHGVQMNLCTAEYDVVERRQPWQYTVVMSLPSDPRRKKAP